MLAPGWVRSSRQSARRHRARPARRRPGRAAARRPPASTSSGSSSRDPSAARMVTRLVSVPKPDPASATSFATSRSTPLRRSFSAARSSDPVSAAKPTRTGAAGRGSRVGAPSLSSPWAIRAISASRSGVGFEPDGQAVGRARASSARLDRPEVGDRGGHDQRVEAGRIRRERGRPAAAPRRRSAVDSARTTVARRPAAAPRRSRR